MTARIGERERYLWGNRTHGLRATYVDGCRCALCREANRAYHLRYRNRFKLQAA